MDEPTSSLSEHEIAALFEQIRMLKEKNVAVIYISHRMKEIFEMCDRATVLRDGCFVSTCMIKDVTENQIVTSMVGREMKDYYNREPHTRGKRRCALRISPAADTIRTYPFPRIREKYLAYPAL